MTSKITFRGNSTCKISCPSPRALLRLPSSPLHLSLPQEDFGGLRGDEGGPTGGLDGRPRVEVEEEVTGGGGRRGQEVHEGGGGPFEGEKAEMEAATTRMTRMLLMI